MEKQIDVNDKTLSLGWCIFGDINKEESGLAQDNMLVMMELWKYDDIYSISLLDENNNKLANKSWDYSWLDWYNERKAQL